MASKEKKLTRAQIAKQLAKEAANAVFGSGQAARAGKAAKRGSTKGVRIPGAKHRND